jgi:phosphate transport system protein
MTREVLYLQGIDGYRFGVAEPLRRAFHQELDDINAKIVQLYALVIESLSAATETFLSADRESARAIVESDALIDSINLDLEKSVERNLLLQSPVASELRFLLSALRIVPELERSGDLAEHIATRAANGIGYKLTPAIRGVIQEMGQVGVMMWRAAADAWADRDASAAAKLVELDDQMDDAFDKLWGLVEKGDVELPVAMEMALVARFYERLGDHAVHITERVRYLAEG